MDYEWCTNVGYDAYIYIYRQKCECDYVHIILHTVESEMIPVYLGVKKCNAI